MSAVAPARSAGAGRGDLVASDLTRRRRPGEAVVVTVLRVCAGLSVVVTVGIVVSLLGPALDFFRQVPVVEFLTGTVWRPNFQPQQYGVLPLVGGTLMTTVIGLLVAVPFGLGSAMYLSEYAGRRTRARLKPVLELLAGVPSVVYGFFALQFVTPVLLQDWLGLEVGFTNVLAAGLVLGVMVIPTVASLSEDAMHAVPDALRQGSFAMGANRMQTTLRVVFPAAISGIAAAIVLGLSRAIGETMIVALAAGSVPNLSLDPREGMQTMTGYVAQTAGGENIVGSLSYDTLFAVGLLLFGMTLVVNLVSISLVRRFRQEY
ncbi:MAG: phosphate ABC transporter permease subunit PstC [Actinomycetota bacterium]|nr:phosphate ABC transporter permease subunit PstC [Actinomycetota bacterium]